MIDRRHERDPRRNDDGFNPPASTPVRSASVLAHDPPRAEPSTGSQLDPQTRTQMEGVIEHDFGRVRVHHDEESARSASALHTRAFTRGSDVFFGRGAWAPASPSGRGLLAHELMHVAQNERAPAEPAREVSEAGDTAELEAAEAAAAALGSGGIRIAPRARPSARIQREPPTPSNIAAASGKPDPNAPTAPKPPAAGNDVVTFRGRQFSTSPEFNRFQLQQFIVETENGEQKARELVRDFAANVESLRLDIEQERKNASARQGSGGTDVSGAPRDLAAMETDYQTRLRVQPVLQAEFDKLVADNATFLRTFETTGQKITLEIMAESEKRALQEFERYGIRKDKVGDATRYGGATNQAAQQMTAAAKELARKHREVRAVRQTLWLHERRKQNSQVDEGRTKWDASDEASLNDAAATVAKVELDLQVMQAMTGSRFPILAAYVESEEKLDELANSGSYLATWIGWDINAKLANIKTVREGLGTTYTVWGLPKISDITKQQMPGVQGNPYYTRLVDDKVRAAKENKPFATELLDALQWMFLLLSFIPVTAPVGAIGTAAVGVANAAIAMRDYQIQAAASGTDFDKARAISSESPSEFWLASQLVFLIPDMMQALKAFRTLAPAARAMKLTGDATEFAAVAKRELPEKADQLIARAEQHGGMASPLIGPTAKPSASAMSLWREFKEDAARAWAKVTGRAIPQAGASFLAPTLAHANGMYEQLLRQTPSREAAIWYCRSGNYFVVVQGTGNWAGGAVNMPQWAGAWHIVEHYHPERNFAVQFASDTDFNSLLALWGGRGNIRQRISSTIRYVDPATGQWHFSYFGYDPHLENTPLGPFFLNIETKGGARLDMSFRDMSEYRNQLARLQKGIEVPQ